jgi:hypothetical protein
MLMVKEVFVFIGFNVAICRESAILNASQHVLKIVLFLFLFLLVICIFGAASPRATKEVTLSKGNQGHGFQPSRRLKSRPFKGHSQTLPCSCALLQHIQPH